MKNTVVMVVLVVLVLVFSGGVLADTCTSWRCTLIGEYRCGNLTWCYGTMYSPKLLELQECLRTCTDVLGNSYDEASYDWASQGCC